MSKEEHVKFSIVSDFIRRKITRSEAALLLDTTERTITRLARNKKSLFGLNGGFFWCPLAEDFRTSIIESITQGIDFSLRSIDT